MRPVTALARLSLLVPVLLVATGLALPHTPGDAPLAQKIAQGLIAACPPADPGDEKARDQSAEKLAHFALLRDSLSDPISWGAHTAGASYAPTDSQTTLFNP